MDINKSTLEDFFCGLLTAYRMNGILGELMTDIPSPELDIAWSTMLEIYKETFNIKSCDIKEYQKILAYLRYFVKTNKKWIEYVLADMHYYSTKHFTILEDLEKSNIEAYRLNRLYLAAMQERVNFLEWNTEAFKIFNKIVNIIDIGCGTCPFADLFYTNNSIRKYTGIDKRDIRSHIIKINNEKKYNIEYINAEFNLPNAINLLSSILKENESNVLFMGEFLHCVKEPLSLLLDIINSTLQSRICKILILEPKQCSQIGMSFAFQYHMAKHAGIYTKIDKNFFKLLDDENKVIVTSVKDASSQHYMYSIDIN